MNTPYNPQQNGDSCMHSTEDWADEDSTLDGITEEQRIQQAANRAASAIRDALRD